MQLWNAPCIGALRAVFADRKHQPGRRKQQKNRDYYEHGRIDKNPPNTAQNRDFRKGSFGMHLLSLRAKPLPCNNMHFRTGTVFVRVPISSFMRKSPFVATAKRQFSTTFDLNKRNDLIYPPEEAMSKPRRIHFSRLKSHLISDPLRGLCGWRAERRASPLLTTDQARVTCGKCLESLTVMNEMNENRLRARTGLPLYGEFELRRTQDTPLAGATASPGQKGGA